MSNDYMEQMSRVMARLLIVTQQLETRAQELEHRASQATQVLERSGQSIQSSMTALASGAERSITQTTEKVLLNCVQQPTQKFGQHIDEIVRHLTDTANRVQREQVSSAAWLKGITWKIMGLLVCSSILLIGGTGYIVWKNAQEIKRQEFSMQLIQATKTGAVNLCDGKLCVKVDKNTKRYGTNGEYVLVEE
jgi:hypothetical protein